jgi:hypothetical protein
MCKSMGKVRERERVEAKEEEAKGRTKEFAAMDDRSTNDI